MQKLENKKRGLQFCDSKAKELDSQIQIAAKKIKSCIVDVETEIKNNISKLNDLFKNCDAHDLHGISEGRYAECSKCGFCLETCLLIKKSLNF